MSGWNPPPRGDRDDSNAGRPGRGVPEAFGSRGRDAEHGDADDGDRAGGGGGRGPFGRSYRPRHRGARRRRDPEHYDDPGDSGADPAADSPDTGESPDRFDAFARRSSSRGAQPTDYADGPTDYASGPWSPGSADQGAGSWPPPPREPGSYDSFGSSYSYAPAGTDDAGPRDATGSDPNAPGPDFYTPDAGVPDPYAPMPVAPDPYGAIQKPVGPDRTRPAAIPPPKQNATVWTGVVIAVATLVVLVGAGVVVLYKDKFNFSTPRRIVRAKVAGGYKIDPDGVAIYSRQFDPYKQILQNGTRNAISAANVVTGVYDAGRDPKTGLRRQILFIGTVHDLGSPGDVRTGISDREKKVGDLEINVSTTDAGPRGGDAFCLETRPEPRTGETPAPPTTACGWVTDNTLGMVALTTSATPAEVAPIMRKMRPDLEIIDED